MELTDAQFELLCRYLNEYIYGPVDDRKWNGRWRWSHDPKSNHRTIKNGEAALYAISKLAAAIETGKEVKYVPPTGSTGSRPRANGSKARVAKRRDRAPGA